MASASYSSQGESLSFFKYVPFINPPAVQARSYRVDSGVVIGRGITGMALTYIAMAGACWLCPPLALLATKSITFYMLSLIVAPYLPGVVEVCRAVRAADAKALTDYKNGTPSEAATNRLCSSPRAFQLLLESGEDLHKVDAQGLTLAVKVLSSGYPTSAEVRRRMLATDLDLIVPSHMGQSLFMHALKCAFIENLEAVLRSGRVKPDEIREVTQSAIWNEVISADKIALLSKYGFNINAKNADGHTPLMCWAYHEELAIAALRAGANPLLTNPQGQTASQLAREGSRTKRLLQQAEYEAQNRPVSRAEVKGLSRWLWTPAVCRDEYYYKADTSANWTRISLIASGSMFIISAASALPPALVGLTMLMILGTAVIGIPVALLEERRGQKEAERIAVNEYLTCAVPTKQATQTIRSSQVAARLLCQHDNLQKHYVNKLNEEGQTLLSGYSVDSKVFKALVDHGADIFHGNPVIPFMHAVKASSAELMAYLLDKEGLVTPATVPTLLQLQMWEAVGCQQTAQFLKNKGFDPNIVDVEGNTALMHLAKTKRSLSGELPIAKIVMLLSVGASLSHTNHAGQTARDLAAEEEIRARLRGNRITD